jgi:hypothetical protein
VRSWRVLIEGLAIDEVLVDTSYADLFLVVREGDDQPGPSDWEATVRTADRTHLRPGRYDLRATTADGHPVAGPALLRFSDGHRHLFRGDGPLAGVAVVVD